MNFETLLKRIRKDLLLLSNKKNDSSTQELEKDVEVFIKASKKKLERWTTLLIKAQITEEEFVWLVKSQKDILVLQELYTAGTSRIALGHLKNKILKTVINTVKTAIKLY